MVILTAAVGLFLAPGMESISFSYGLICLLGIAILVMGSCVANCYVEREEDKKMRRTQNRALPSGRVSPRSALILSLSMIVFSLVTLAWAINLLTAFLGLWACILYVFVYTPLKSKSTMALFIGAIPGALPPVLGWTSVTGSLDWWPLILFAIIFFWQVPHFIAIGLYREEDYKRAGFKTISLQSGVGAARGQILIFSTLLVLVSLSPVYLGLMGRGYLCGVLVLGIPFCCYALRGCLATTGFDGRNWARGFFFSTLCYLPMLLTVALIF